MEDIGILDLLHKLFAGLNGKHDAGNNNNSLWFCSSVKVVDHIVDHTQSLATTSGDVHGATLVRTQSVNCTLLVRAEGNMLSSSIQILYT